MINVKRIVDRLPPEIARQIHPDRRRNEEAYWAVRDQLLEQYAAQWIGFADGKVIASGSSPVAVFHAAEASGKHPFFICVGSEEESCRIRRVACPYDASYREKFCPMANINTYETLECALMDEIPKAVKNACRDEIFYCLRIYYDGTDTPREDFATRLRLLKQDHRQACLASGSEPAWVLYLADETDCEEHGPDLSLADSEQIRGLCGRVYQRMCEDELFHLKQLRRTVQRVAKKLNCLDWSPYCKVTDDFIVYAADGSHTFCDDFVEMARSVPLRRILMLRFRKLIPIWALWYIIGRKLTGL